MKIICHAVFISLLLTGLAGAGGVGDQPAPVLPPPPEPLLAEAVWAGAELPGQWRDTSVTADERVREAETPPPLFGVTPQTLRATVVNGKLRQLTVVYLEAGLFFGTNATEEAKRRGADDARLRRQLEHQVQEAERTERRTERIKRREFDTRFRELESVLPARLSAALGGKGQSVSVGEAGLLKSRLTEYRYLNLRLRLRFEDEQLVALVIAHAEDSGRELLAGVKNYADRKERRLDSAANVQTLANGDVIIDDIPAFNQGDRGYCAMGVLGMVMRYYGLQVDIDTLAAKAGYRQGDVRNANVLAVYSAAAREAKVRLMQTERVDAKAIQKRLQKGQPVIVWRWFSDERDRFHAEFAQRYRLDPSALLPDPRRDRSDRKRWPKASEYGHASLITGFNPQRDEFIFSESWGNDSRNRRMRVEEMEATAFQLFYFEP